MIIRFDKVCLALLLVLIGLTPGSAAADTLWLKNGDRLTGTCVSMAEAKLVFKTDYAGEVVISLDAIRSLATDGPVKVDLGLAGGGTEKGDNLRSVRLAEADAGQVKLVEGESEVSLPLKEIRAINPPQKKTLTWSGEVNLGYGLQSGNTNQSNINADLRIKVDWHRNRFTFGGESQRERANGQDTADKDLAYLEYNRLLTKRWYAFGNIQADRDRFKDLDVRAAAGGGLGYRFIHTERTELTFELGPNYLWQQYTGQDGFGYLAGRWAIKASHWMFAKRLQIYHRQTGFSRVDDPGRIVLQTRQGLKIPIAHGIAASLQYNLDWESRPQPGKKEADTGLFFKLGYDW